MSQSRDSNEPPNAGAAGEATPTPTPVTRLEPVRRRRLGEPLLAGVLALGAVLWMLAVEGSQGIGRDEAQYFRAGRAYWGWFAGLADNLRAGRLAASFKAPAIDSTWGDNPEHPPVMKVLYGVSWRVFWKGNRTIPLFERHATAYRFPAILFAGLGLVLVFLFARQFVGRAAAAGAAVMSFAIPHYFFHAQISCFDAPITVMAVAVGYAYWRSLRAARWGVAAGVVFGVALGVKHNAWLMPVFLVAHYVWMRRGDLRRLRPPRVPLAFLSMLILGPLVLLALWPRLWPDPVARTRWYVLRHLDHEHYHFAFLDENFKNPPKEPARVALRVTFPWVSTLLTIPVTTLALAGVGAAVLVRRSRRRDDEDPVLLPGPPRAARPSFLRPGADVDRALGAFLLIQALGPLAVLSVPSTPVFGGVKHFMTGWPYLAIAAGIGLEWLIRVLRRVLARAVQGGKPTLARLAPALPALATVVVCAPAVAETRRSHPDGLAHYNLLAGGFAGGASLGMNRQFWGYSIRPMLRWIAQSAPPSRRVYWHDVFVSAVHMYAADRLLPDGLGDVGVGEDAVAASDLGLIVHEKHFAVYEGLLMETYGTTKPAYVRTREGVPIVTAYRRPGLPPAPMPMPTPASRP